MPAKARQIKSHLMGSFALERSKGAYPRLISRCGVNIANKLPLGKLEHTPPSNRRPALAPPSLLTEDEPWGGLKRWSDSPVHVDEVAAFIRVRDLDATAAITDQYRIARWDASPLHLELAGERYLSPQMRKHRYQAAAATPSDESDAWLQSLAARAAKPQPCASRTAGREEELDDSDRGHVFALSQHKAAAGACRALFLPRQSRRPVFDHVRAARSSSGHARLVPGLALG